MTSTDNPPDVRTVALGLLLALGALACTPRFPNPTPVPTLNPTVILGSGVGKLSTSTPVEPTASATPSPTETELVAAARSPVPAAPITFPVLRSPTPELRATRTVEPSPTFVPSATPIPTPPRVALSPTATRTARVSSPVATPLTQRPPSTAVPLPPNPDIGTSQTLVLGTETAGVHLRQGQSAVYRFTVAPAEGTVVATVTGPGSEAYLLTAIAPDGIQAGSTVPVGTLGRQLRAPIRNQPGLWYLEVQADPRARAPTGPFSIRVDVR